MEKILPLIKNKRTLDVGCGGGGLTNMYYSVTKELIGIDFSPDAINFGKIRYPHLNLKQINVFELKDNFKPKDFEVVIANDIIEHLYDHDKFIENRKQVLPDNGHLVIGTDLNDTPASKYKILKLFRNCLLPLGWDGIKFLMLRYLELPRDKLKNYHENHVKTLSQQALIPFLEKHGFRVEKILIYNLIRVIPRDVILNIFRWVTGLEMNDHQLVLCRKISKVC